MRTSELARLAEVHPNTVRLYEQWGYISPAPRAQNGYRQYSLLHALQLKVARIVFRQEFIQNNLRKLATAIVIQCGKENFDDALLKCKQYHAFLSTELAFTHKAVLQVSELLSSVPEYYVVYSHKEVAEQLQLTEETLRNWERNGLYSVHRTAQNRRVYEQSDVNRLLVIRTLRSAHFSISSILHLFNHIHADSSVEDIKKSLITPAFLEKFLHVTDALELNLKKAITDANTVIALLEGYIKGDLSLQSLSSTN